MQENIKFIGVERGHIKEIWPFILPLLRKSESRLGGRYRAEDYYASLLSGDTQLWVYFEGKELKALSLTAIVNYALYKACQISLVAGGSFNNWIKYMDVIEDWAFSKGCKRIELRGRKGWRKRLNKSWKTIDITMEKEIKNGKSTRTTNNSN
ncbi:MAG: hypothetical protein ACTSXQ_00315 [Alphaproteobacteria bacterium]